MLLTGEFPTPEEFEEISKEFKSRAELGDDLKQFIKDLPVEMHAMTQLSSSLLYLQPTSKFVNAVLHGTHKEQLWEYTLEDALDLLAKIPRIAAFIYRHKYKENEFIEPNLELDWAGNFAHMMGYKDFEMRECLRGYLAIHSYVSVVKEFLILFITVIMKEGMLVHIPLICWELHWLILIWHMQVESMVWQARFMAWRIKKC